MKKWVMRVFFVVLLGVSLVGVVAHGGAEEEVQRPFYEDPYFRIFFPAFFIVVIAFLANQLEKRDGNRRRVEAQKKVLFGLIVVVVLVIAGSTFARTVYVNVKSWSKGPVHWHADFELWDCGVKLDLVDPSNLANRIGTSAFHEHDDNRLHVEAPVMDPGDIHLSEFFEGLGGELRKGVLRVPGHEGFVERRDGDLCGGVRGEVQVFVYKVRDAKVKPWVYDQEKLVEFEEYVLSPFGDVPPGDCIIVEFDVGKERTDKVCYSYKAKAVSGVGG